VAEATARDNTETLRKAFEALTSEGIEGVLQYCSPDLVVFPFPEWMEAPKYEGHAGFRELLNGWMEGFEDFRPEIHEFRTTEDGRVVWLGWNTGVIKGAGTPIKQPVGGVHRFRDGLLAEVSYFMTWEEALEAAGLG
jgi:ketosteroid isomerase-like protein